MSQRTTIPLWDVEELAAHILGITELYEKSDNPSEFIEEAFSDKFELDILDFHKMCEHLLPLVAVGHAVLANKMYRGFADKANGLWLVKEEIE